MPNIKPVSDLRNYGEVLRDVAVGQPVFLTKNGHGRYAVLDMEEYRQYEKLMAMQKLMTELEKGRRSGKSVDDYHKHCNDDKCDYSRNNHCFKSAHTKAWGNGGEACCYKLERKCAGVYLVGKLLGAVSIEVSADSCLAV